MQCYLYIKYVYIYIHIIHDVSYIYIYHHERSAQRFMREAIPPLKQNPSGPDQMPLKDMRRPAKVKPAAA